MLALYKILIVDGASDSKNVQDKYKLIYDLIYMDNGCITPKDVTELSERKELLKNIFEPYQFYLQQFVTNDSVLQEELDSECQTETSS